MRRMPPLGEPVTLKPDEFRALRDLFAARTGLHFGPESRFSLERRLRERLKVLKLSSFGDYNHYLRFGTQAVEEWDEAIDLLTTNETYFFREERQLRALRNEILPMLHAQLRSRRRLSIWSAGCATGEEAYTIGILVQGTHLFLPDSATDARWDVRIYGSDISRRCVAMARRGVFPESSFRVTPKDVRRAFFQERPDGWHVSESIRSMCHFGQMNLLDEDRSRVFGNSDVIFCRNVLIYFDARARKAAIEILYERLNPGGILLLGHSESLLNVSTAFELLHLRDDLVYRKPASAPVAAPRPGPVQVTAPGTKPIRLLVVDDSAYNRRNIAEVFADQPEVEVVGKAADGEEALKLVSALKPDVITLDLEMPRMDGFTFLRILMAKAPTPVIVVSSYSQRENVFKALELGALDFVPKPERLGTEATEVREEILQKVLLVRALRPSFVPTSLIRRQAERTRTTRTPGLTSGCLVLAWLTVRRRSWSRSRARLEGPARCCTSSGVYLQPPPPLSSSRSTCRTSSRGRSPSGSTRGDPCEPSRRATVTSCPRPPASFALAESAWSSSSKVVS